MVSDFVMRDYFDDTAAGRHGARFDFMGHLTSPFSLAPGGYQSIYLPGQGWTQRTADKVPGARESWSPEARRELILRKGPLSRMALRVHKSQGTVYDDPELKQVVDRTRELLGAA